MYFKEDMPGEVRAETPKAKAKGFLSGIVYLATSGVKRLNPYPRARPCHVPFQKSTRRAARGDR